jgi:DNA-binding ferritin-like protein
MENVVNLSAFGDIIEKPKKEEGGNEFMTFDQMRSNMIQAPTGSEPAAEDKKSFAPIFSKIIENTAQIKILHWQTNFYGQHKALDAFYHEFNEVSDKLAESIMGKYGKPTLSDADGSLRIYNYKNPENADLSEFLAHLYECYNKDCRSYFSVEKDEELINIIDEIVGLVDQNKYLLGLK